MSLLTLRPLFAAIILLTAHHAEAMTYHQDQDYSGTFTLSDAGSGLGSFENTFTSIFVNSGDSTLFSSGMVSQSYIYDPLSQLPSGTFVETLISGDTFFGSWVATGASSPAPGTNAYTGTFVIGGGTGSLLGATGSGSWTATSTFINAISGTVTQNSVFTISAPVPEPHTYAMLLAGLGLVGAVARRRVG